MPVNIARDACAVVAEQISDLLEVDARFQPHRARGVLQRVDADAFDLVACSGTSRQLWVALGSPITSRQLPYGRIPATRH